MGGSFPPPFEGRDEAHIDSRFRPPEQERELQRPPPDAGFNQHGPPQHDYAPDQGHQPPGHFQNAPSQGFQSQPPPAQVCFVFPKFA